MNTETALPTTPVEITQPKYRTIGYYKEEVMKSLSPDIFKPNPWRLVGYGLCAVGSLGSFFVIVNQPLPWPVKLLLGMLLGFCNGTLAFMAHEVGHGSVVRNQKLQDVLGFFGAFAFFISPTFWKYWHNRLHHSRTQQLIRDPDAFPNMRIYKSSKFMKFMYPFTPGSGHKRSYFYFFFWFSFHNFVAQSYLRFRNSVFNDLNHKRVTIEFTLQLLLGAGLLIYAGVSNWLWVFLVPLFVQNYLLMSYIATNHNLSPLTDENDPLLNSLSVKNNPVIEFLNLNFGYHVEHHIFPTVSGSHMKAVHRVLVEKFPEKYQIMPKWKAMKALYATSRIYKNSNELINPETLKTYPTIQPKKI